MNALSVLAADGEPSPSPTAPDTVPIELWEASPGIYGFLFFFAMACALIVLVRSMLRHSRTVEQNSQRREEAEARAVQETPEAGTQSDAVTPPEAGTQSGAEDAAAHDGDRPGS